MNPYSDTSAKPEEKKKPNPTTVRVDSDGNKIYTIDTSHWNEKVRKIYEEHFGKLPEEETVHTSVADKKPLILNDLHQNPTATTGNKPAKPETTCITQEPAITTATTGNEPAIPATHEPAIPTTTTSYLPTSNWTWAKNK